MNVASPRGTWAAATTPWFSPVRLGAVPLLCERRQPANRTSGPCDPTAATSGNSPISSTTGTLVPIRVVSPDGEWIVHASYGVGGNADLFVMHADGTGNRPLTHTQAWDSAPDWGPPSP